jgi:hypothetical protein
MLAGHVSKGIRTAVPTDRPFVAGNQSELESLWTALEVPERIPPIDFDEYVVVGFARSELCTPAELLRIGLYGDTASPEFISTRSCSTRRTVSRVVAVAREGLPRGFQFLVPTDDSHSCLRGLAARREQHEPARREEAKSSPVAPKVDAASRGSKSIGRGPMPAPGAVLPSVLDDGSPVWISRHPDGSLTVLDPVVADQSDVPGYHGGFVGVARLADSWFPGSGRFARRWDAWGVHVFSTDSNLNRYEAHANPERADEVLIGGRLAFDGADWPQPPGDAEGDPTGLLQQDATTNTFAASSVSKLDGRMIRFSGMLYFDGERACATTSQRGTHPTGKCPADAAWAPQVAPVRKGTSLRIVIENEFLARPTHEGQLVDVVRAWWSDEY